MKHDPNLPGRQRQEQWIHEARNTRWEQPPLAWGAITHDAAFGVAVTLATIVAMLAVWVWAQ